MLAGAPSSLSAGVLWIRTRTPLGPHMSRGINVITKKLVFFFLLLLNLLKLPSPSTVMYSFHPSPIWAVYLQYNIITI